MKVSAKSIKVGPKFPFVRNLLIIEGITRSGKFLLANILNGFENIEPAQYSVLLEEIPFLTSLGKIEKDTAKELLRCEIDSRCYEMLIGRNLNIRKSDKSSVYNNPNYHQFLARANQQDKELLTRKFIKQKVYSSFILHESMANISIYFETFPKTKCICILRDPIDLAYSWYKRGLGKRWGTDPLLFQIPFSDSAGKNIFPWFASGWKDVYLKSNEMTTCVLSIKSLIEKAQEGYRNLSGIYKKNILVVNYEDFLLNPNSEINKISKFLNVEILTNMNKILKSENLPQKQPQIVSEKLIEMQKLVNSSYLKELASLPKNYLI